MTRAVMTLADVRGLSPAQAAARWMACDDLDQSPEREQHQQWLEASPDNQAAWDAVQEMWGVFDDAEDNDLIAAMGRAARQAKPEPVRSFWPQAIAASIAVVAVSATLLVGVQGGWFSPAGKSREVASNTVSSDPLRTVGTADYVTGRGQKTIVDLADGTRVTLDADSAVDVTFSDTRRDVRLLKGRAFFDVAHDPAHPFAVQADNRVVTALGTQFDVRLTPGALRVVLAQGSVSVAAVAGSANAPLVKLRPGRGFRGPWRRSRQGLADRSRRRPGLEAGRRGVRERAARRSRGQAQPLYARPDRHQGSQDRGHADHGSVSHRRRRPLWPQRVPGPAGQAGGAGRQHLRAGRGQALISVKVLVDSRFAKRLSTFASMNVF
jgi:ferric-dicitrate binding protein FerR (iron transport regulator)